MILYAVIMLAAACSFFLLGRAVYRGNTNLIHDYHQTKVTDPAAYGKAFGKAMFVVAMTLFLSGIAGLFGDSETTAKIAVAILFAGLILGIGCIIAVQKKYNNGIF